MVMAETIIHSLPLKSKTREGLSHENQPLNSLIIVVYGGEKKRKPRIGEII
jgi:hypothetical protein